MGGGLMQLVAYGAQDIYLTGNPQITFFKVVYRRHTNFSMEAIQQTINGTSKTPASGTASGTVTISRNGDLVHKVYVRMVSEGANSITSDGHDLISEVELEIGGQRIDRHVAQWMQVWSELSTPESKSIGYKAMTGGVGGWGHSTGSNTGVDFCMVPLQFWFCRNPGLALPLIALQYHEVKLKFTWAVATGDQVDCSIWCDYIYLDTDERRRFAQVSHEYLIEQLQYQAGGGADASSEKLNFNHPVKELIWTESLNRTYDSKCKLVLNGHDRFAAQDAEYFTLKQPFDYHSAVPRQNLPTSAQLTSNYADITATDSLTVASATAEVDGGGGTTAVGPATTELGIVKFLDYKAATPGQSTVNILSAGTTWAGVITARTTEAVAYLFLNTDMPGLAAGDLVQITGSGSRFIGGSAAGSTVIARVTDSFLSDAGGGTADLAADIRVLQFDRVLFTALTSILAGEVVISSVNKITANSPLVTQARTSKETERINVYSFALKPEEHQPSGTCNFSRIDTAKLEFSGGTGPTITNIYAVNYNVLRIMSGMGGLAYSN
jgi:hypothetical protein